MPQTPPLVAVPRLAPGGTVVCIGTGPSLTQADVELCRGYVVVAVNDAVRLAPWADCCHASDAAWWRVHQGVPSFGGRKFSLEHVAAAWPGITGVTVLRNTGVTGIETDPTGLRTGRNSGGAAINLAVHLGAKRILLLGYDMGVTRGAPTHFFGNHPAPLRNNSPFPLFLKAFEAMVAPLQALRIEVINCSRVSALNCFPRRVLADVLQAQPQEAA